MSYADLMTEDRRLTILKALEMSGAYECNEFLLLDQCAAFGHNVSGDRLRTDLAWLREQELLGVREIGPLQIAKLTARGLDVAQGRTVVPGVKRPRPVA